MHAEYKRDMNHNYLIFTGEAPVDTDSYQVRMLSGNILPSFLKCHFQGMNGKTLFYYDITSRQSLSARFEQRKFHMEDLQLVFGGFVRVMEEMAEHLLNPCQLVLNPEYMFLDAQGQEMFFCYFPGYGKEMREQFQALTEYVLPRLDHQDGRAVMLGYGVYRRALEDSFHLEYIKEELYQVREERTAAGGDRPEGNAQMAAAGDPISGESVRKTFYEKKDEKGDPEDDFPEMRREDPGHLQGKPAKRRKSLPVLRLTLGVLGAALGFAAVTAAKIWGCLPWLHLEGILGAALISMAAAAFWIWRKDRKKEREKPGEAGGEPVRSSPWPSEEFFREPIRPAPAFSEDESEKPVPEMPQEEKQEDFGETAVLSAGTDNGPASLVSREPGELATIYLEKELTVIGKLETAADAVILLPTVSRMHAKIRRREEEYYLSDLNSRNGTAVNGRMLKGDEEYCLQNEDEVDFAQARYIFLK